MPIVRKLDSFPITVHPPDGLPYVVFVNWRVIDSSNIERVGWNRDGADGMFVQFKSGAVYWYKDVTRQRAMACADAPSTGEYLAYKIKPRFQAVKIHD